MKRGRIVAFLVALLIVWLPAVQAAYAGGDQVNRPDGSGQFEDGQQSAGVLPPWSPREQRDSTP